MNRRLVCWLLIVAGVALLPFRSPAPLVYRPGEGWTYEPVGEEGKWQRDRAKDQLAVATEAFNQNDFSLSLKAAKRVVKSWPLSDYAPDAQFLIGRCYELKNQDERAFDEYQKLVEKYPKSDKIKDVQERQYDIATRFYNGQWFKLWGYIPLPPSMDRTAEMYEKIVKNGPYSPVAPMAQLHIGAAREKQHNYPEAVTAYERAADRYHDRPNIASDAMYRTGVSYEKQAARAEYDQSTAGKAIASYTDFMTYYPDDKRVPKAEKTIAALKTEQARGNFMIAKFYEDRHSARSQRPRDLRAAVIYYNEVVVRDPNSPYAGEAKQRIDEIQKRLQSSNK